MWDRHDHNATHTSVKQAIPNSAAMALESSFQSLSITESRPEPDCLPFNTSLSSTLSESESDQAIPRYLFRVISSRSQGMNNNIWMKSYDAASLKVDSKVDIFVKEPDRAAAMLDRHLRWENVVDGDNLISWTSSQLFAVQYIMYLHNSDRIALKLIKLCVIDTTGFPLGTFLRDLELIQAFRPFDPNLGDLARLRGWRHKYHSGHYYFGEYLCQGALKVAGRCQLVDASALVDRGLFTLLPRLQEPSREWANRVIFLREEYATDTPVKTTVKELLAVINIAHLYEPRWRLPIATYLLALRPRTSDDEDILHTLNPQVLKDSEGRLIQRSGLVIRGVDGEDMKDEDIKDFAFKTKVATHEYLPEVAQVQSIILSLRADYSNTELLKSMQSACRSVRLANHRSIQFPAFVFQPHRNALQETRYQRVRRYVDSLRYELSRLEKALPDSEASGRAVSPEETDLEDYYSDSS